MRFKKDGAWHRDFGYFKLWCKQQGKNPSHADVLHPTRVGLIWHLDAQTVHDVKSGKIKITFDKKKVNKKRKKKD